MRARLAGKAGTLSADVAQPLARALTYPARGVRVHAAKAWKYVPEAFEGADAAVSLALFNELLRVSDMPGESKPSPEVWRSALVCICHDSPSALCLAHVFFMANHPTLAPLLSISRNKTKCSISASQSSYWSAALGGDGSMQKIFDSEEAFSSLIQLCLQSLSGNSDTTQIAASCSIAHLVENAPENAMQRIMDAVCAYADERIGIDVLNCVQAEDMEIFNAPEGIPYTCLVAKLRGLIRRSLLKMRQKKQGRKGRGGIRKEIYSAENAAWEDEVRAELAQKKGDAAASTKLSAEDKKVVKEQLKVREKVGKIPRVQAVRSLLYLPWRVECTFATTLTKAMLNGSIESHVDIRL